MRRTWRNTADMGLVGTDVDLFVFNLLSPATDVAGKDGILSATSIRMAPKCIKLALLSVTFQLFVHHIILMISQLNLCLGLGIELWRSFWDITGYLKRYTHENNPVII